MASQIAPPLFPFGDSGLARYLVEIRRFRMLEREEEYLLAKRWREHGDADAAQQLITSHLRLVTKIALRYRGYGLPVSDVISEGTIGLMQAVKRFDPDRGFRLATYAIWWIKATIREYILRSWSLVRLGTGVKHRKLFFNLGKAKWKISALEEGDLHPEQVELIARRLDVTEQNVIEMNRRLRGDVSLNSPTPEQSEPGEWQDRLVDESSSQETQLLETEETDKWRKVLGEALNVLDERERRIFEARRMFDEPITLEELANEFRLSGERIRQIEVRAFAKVQASVKDRLAVVRGMSEGKTASARTTCMPSGRFKTSVGNSERPACALHACGRLQAGVPSHGAR